MHHSVTLAGLLAALMFAAERHKNERRKDTDASPYINHLIAVAEVLVAAGIEDAVVLIAAVLHDTVEDTATTPAEIEATFGPAVAAVVAEVTDDKTLPKARRKALQIEHAPGLTPAAKLIKIADKISNVHDVAEHPPRQWDIRRRREYVEWAAAVVDGCRGVHAGLESIWDGTLADAQAKVAREG